MENKTLNTGLTIGAFVLGVVGLIMGIMVMAGNESVIGSAITLSMVLMGLAAGVAIIFGLVQLISNFKQNLPLIIGAVGFIILAIICYSIASDALMPTYKETVTAAASKASGAGLFLMYVLIGAALVAAVAGEVVKLFK